MNREEIKQQHSMIEIVRDHGFQPNKRGYISCPFHQGDREASMKVYKDSYYCFGCGASGDIFSFIQHVDQCDFKMAFYSLGGTYEKPTSASRMAVYHLQKAKENRIQKEQRLKKKISLNNKLIGVYVLWLKKLEPLSDEWCDCMDAYIKCLYTDEFLQEEMKGSDKT